MVCYYERRVDYKFIAHLKKFLIFVYLLKLPRNAAILSFVKVQKLISYAQMSKNVSTYHNKLYLVA